MSIKNTTEQYGWVAIIIHWVSAVAVIGLFCLGYWMVELTYYDEWYKKGPDIHRSVGILLVMLTTLRIVWRLINPAPRDLSDKAYERVAAHAVHMLLYAFLLVMFISGYLISTAAGDPIVVFGLFEVPATIEGGGEQADTAGLVHEYMAYTLMVVVALHAGAALKHHFIDRDQVLKRMLGRADESGR